jgi:hypothetical protein
MLCYYIVVSKNPIFAIMQKSQIITASEFNEKKKCYLMLFKIYLINKKGLI